MDRSPIQGFVHSPAPVAYIIYTRSMGGRALNLIDPRLATVRRKKASARESASSRLWVKSQSKR